jgi:hypothetical protein
MRELRPVALSEDGGYLVLADTAGGADPEKFRVPVDDRLRAALRGARRSEVRQESALTPREIQARLRAGETAAEVARVAGIPVERVERYEGPVLAERARVVQEARAALLPKDPGGAPGRPLGEMVDARLLAAQDSPDGAQWDAWRRVDGIWLVQLTSESRCARWTWDPVVRRVRPHDDAARALVAPETPVEPPPAPAPLAGQSGGPRPSGPALTLVQEPAAASVPSMPSVLPTIPVAASTPPPVTHPPVAVPPPTPVQPAAARGRTHGASRPTARGGEVLPSPAALLRPAQPPRPEPAAVPVETVPVAEVPVAVRDVRPLPAAPGVPVVPIRVPAPAPGPIGAGTAGPAPASTGPAAPLPAPADLVPPAPAGPRAAGTARAADTPGTQPRPAPEPAAEPATDDGTAGPGQSAPAARERPGPPGRQTERNAGSRRGRKSVPAWDDIVFGARRP